jgi:hypothetical protein
MVVVCWPSGTGQPYRTATHRKGLGRAEAGGEGEALVRRERSHTEWCVHT